MIPVNWPGWQIDPNRHKWGNMRILVRNSKAGKINQKIICGNILREDFYTKYKKISQFGDNDASLCSMVYRGGSAGEVWFKRYWKRLHMSHNISFTTQVRF